MTLKSLFSKSTKKSLEVQTSPNVTVIDEVKNLYFELSSKFLLLTIDKNLELNVILISLIGSQRSFDWSLLPEVSLSCSYNVFNLANMSP